MNANQPAGNNNRMTITLVIVGVALFLLIIAGGVFFALSRDSDEDEEASQEEPSSSESEDPEDGGDEEGDEQQEDEQDDTEEPEEEVAEDDQEAEMQSDEPNKGNYEQLTAYINENYVRCSTARQLSTIASETPYSIQDCDPDSDAEVYYGFEITKTDSNQEKLLEAIGLEGYFQCIDAEGGAYLAAIGDGFAVQSWVVYGDIEGVELGSAEYIEELNAGTRAEAQKLEAAGFEVEVVDACQL